MNVRFGDYMNTSKRLSFLSKNSKLSTILKVCECDINTQFTSYDVKLLAKVHSIFAKLIKPLFI